MAIALRQPRSGLIVHTDRGSQYASQSHRDLLARQHEWQGQLLGARSLPSGHNAVMERFFLSLKMERVWQRH